MNPRARHAKLSTYRSVAVYGGLAQADPHGLVLMLLDGVLERLVEARGCIERGAVVRKSQLLHSCVTLIAELRGSLDLSGGGELAHNLSDLYDYIARQILRANLENNGACIVESASLLAEIRSAWAAIGPQVRAGGSGSRTASVDAKG